MSARDLSAGMYFFIADAQDGGMWKLFALLVAIFSLCTMAGCDVEEMSSLSDLSKPYAGVYECERMTLGGEDVLGDFRYLRLELGYGGDFTLSWRGEEGRPSVREGTYAADCDANTVTLTVKEGGRELSRTYRMEKGSILVDDDFLGRSLFAEFKM